MMSRKISIAVCDDEKVFREQIQEMIAQYLQAHDIAYEITLFEDGTYLYENQVADRYDIFFLDIQMNEINGMDLAWKLREQNQSAEIVFITVMKEYAFEGYEVEAFRYILKNDIKQLLPSCLESYLKKRGRKKKIKGTFTDGSEELDYDDLIYVESQLRTLCFYTKEGELYQKRKLSDLEKELGDSKEFVRCHQSFLINLGYVKMIKNYVAYLKNDIQIPIAKPKFRDVKQKYLEFKEVD